MLRRRKMKLNGILNGRKGRKTQTTAVLTAEITVVGEAKWVVVTFVAATVLAGLEITVVEIIAATTVSRMIDRAVTGEEVVMSGVVAVVKIHATIMLNLKIEKDRN